MSQTVAELLAKIENNKEMADPVRLVLDLVKQLDTSKTPQELIDTLKKLDETQNKSSKVIVAKWNAYSVFKIPKKYQNLPLECFGVVWDKLYITPPGATEAIEVDVALDAQDNIDWKRPHEIEIDDAEDWNCDNSDDEESDEEDDKFNCKCLGCDKVFASAEDSCGWSKRERSFCSKTCEEKMPEWESDEED